LHKSVSYNINSSLFSKQHSFEWNTWMDSSIHELRTCICSLSLMITHFTALFLSLTINPASSLKNRKSHDHATMSWPWPFNLLDHWCTHDLWRFSGWLWEILMWLSCSLSLPVHPRKEKHASKCLQFLH
jgi:hypothetical protein